MTLVFLSVHQMLIHNYLSNKIVRFFSYSEVFNLSSKIKKNQTGHNYVLQVFLLIVNKEELKSPLVEEVSARCVFSDLTFIVCWDILSAATYIKNVKVSICWFV